MANVDYYPFILHCNMWSVPCWYRCWAILYIKTYSCLNHKWNHIHFLCFPFLRKTLVILWTRHSGETNLCHCTIDYVCTLYNMNVTMIPVGILISTPWSCAFMVSGRTKCQEVPTDWQGGSPGVAERSLSSVGYWYMVRFKTQSETFS